MNFDNFSQAFALFLALRADRECSDANAHYRMNGYDDRLLDDVRRADHLADFADECETETNDALFDRGVWQPLTVAAPELRSAAE